MTIKCNIVMIVFFFISLNVFPQENNNNVENITFYYLPWNLTDFGGKLTANLVRNYNKGNNCKFILTDKDKIDEIINSLSIINLILLGKDSSNNDLRMVIDIHYENETKTILLDKNRTIIYNNYKYFRNKKFLELLDLYLPDSYKLQKYPCYGNMPY